MNDNDMKLILEKVRKGDIDVDEALKSFRNLPFEDIGYAKIDHHRAIRNGFPEVIYGEGKAVDHIIGIMETMIQRKSNVLATRISKEVYEKIKHVSDKMEYNELARIITIEHKALKKSKGKILVMTAGTADISVAEEAALTAEMFGNTAERLYDVGVAGIHRLLANIEKLNEASVIITVAGMEGALASVVGGLVDKPVVAVPTSVGYGANFKGVSALLTMLNSCSSGIGVVNIDNGFGGAYLASTINRQIELAREGN